MSEIDQNTSYPVKQWDMDLKEHSLEDQISVFRRVRNVLGGFAVGAAVVMGVTYANAIKEANTAEGYDMDVIASSSFMTVAGIGAAVLGVAAYRNHQQMKEAQAEMKLSDLQNNS